MFKDLNHRDDSARLQRERVLDRVDALRRVVGALVLARAAERAARADVNVVAARQHETRLEAAQADDRAALRVGNWHRRECVAHLEMPRVASGGWFKHWVICFHHEERMQKDGTRIG